MGNDAAASPNVPQAGQPERTDRKRLAEETQKEKDLAVAQVPATIPGALAVRCPHCHYSIARCEGDLLSEITCPACGSHFSLLAVEDTLAYPAAGPRTIAGFQLIEQVGMGQYGTVWKARDLQLDRLVAVKIPRRSQMDAAEIGVKEYFLYDPTSEYLLPPLRGFRLTEDGYREIQPERSAGAATLLCRELGILHHLEAGELVMTDSRTGQRLLTGEEAEAAARQAEAAARQAAEAEVQRLRALLEGKDTPR